MPPARILLYLATTGAFAMVGYALLAQPPPLWLSIVALTGYLLLVVGGVLLANFSMFADVVTHGPDNARGVALTFDDGPDPSTTPRILEILAEADARATFFVIGRKAEQHPSLVRSMVEAGHAVGIHSYAHDRLFALRSPRAVRRDLRKAIQVLERITGDRPTLFRAPIGHISPAIGHALLDLRLQAVGWSVRAFDGRSGAKPDKVAARVIPKLRDGGIVLLHDAAERGDFEPAALGALGAILAAMDRQQLPHARVDHWLGEGEAEDVEAAHDA